MIYVPNDLLAIVLYSGLNALNYIIVAACTFCSSLFEVLYFILISADEWIFLVYRIIFCATDLSSSQPLYQDGKEC